MKRSPRWDWEARMAKHRRYKSPKGTRNPNPQPTQSVLTAADYAYKVKSLQKSQSSGESQTTIGSSRRIPSRTMGIAPSSEMHIEERLTPTAVSPTQDEEGVASQINELRGEIGGIEGRIVEHAKDKAVSEVIKTMILPSILALLAVAAGLFIWHGQSLQAMKAEVDERIDMRLTTWEQKILTKVDNKLKAIDTKSQADVTEPKAAQAPAKQPPNH
jgi:hypothetical protein